MTILERIQRLSAKHTVEVFNRVNDFAAMSSTFVADMDEFDDMFTQMKPSEIAEMIQYSPGFSTRDDWFWFDELGRIVSGCPIQEVFWEEDLAESIRVLPEKCRNEVLGLIEILEHKEGLDVHS